MIAVNNRDWEKVYLLIEELVEVTQNKIFIFMRAIKCREIEYRNSETLMIKDIDHHKQRKCQENRY